MNNNDGRDKDLDQLLGPLKKVKPNDLQIQSWQSAVKNEALNYTTRVYSVSRTQWAVQLVAALFVGFVIGALVFKYNSAENQQSSTMVQFSLDDATFERSHANLD